MVCAVLRVLALTLWAAIAPLAFFAFEVRLTQFWQLPLNGDLFLLILFALAAAVGGLSLLLFIRLSLPKRLGIFFGYWVVASVVVFLFYPAIVCYAIQCP
jgi:hypothetical protein